MKLDITLDKPGGAKALYYKNLQRYYLNDYVLCKLITLMMSYNCICHHMIAEGDEI